MCPCQKVFFVLGSLLGLVAFAAGAFGSHALKMRLPLDYLNIYETAVRYQMYHAFILIGIAWASTVFSSPLIPLAGWLMLMGILIFSGSLYTLVLTDTRWWGAITPIGGVILLIGWIFLVIGGMVSEIV